MHVLIIEAVLTGHHSGYLERIAAAYMERGDTVTLAVSQRDAAHPAISRLNFRFSGVFSIFRLDNTKIESAFRSRLGVSGRELTCWQVFGRAYVAVNQANPVDYVFLPYLDYCLYAVGLLGSPFGATQWGGICMRPSFHYRYFSIVAPAPKLAYIKRALFLKLLRSKTLASLYTIDELLLRFVAERYSQLTHRLTYLPDPAELNGIHTYESARQALGISSGAVVVLVYGAIDERKGLDILVDAVSSAPVLKTLHLLVVGSQSPALHQLMESSQVSALAKEGRFQVIDSFVNETVEQMVFIATNVVWLGYRRHYSMSGVLVLAAICGLPVVATEEGLIGWYTKKHKLGSTININSSCQVINALQLLMIKNQPLDVELKFEDSVFNTHNWNTFISKILLNKLEGKL